MVRRFLLLCLLAVAIVSAREENPQVRELKDYVSTILPSLDGWCSQEKAMALIDLIIEEKPQVCVEIGVFGGSSLFPMASALKFLGQGVVIGIDPWDRMECLRNLDPIKDANDVAWWGSVDLTRIYNSYQNMLKTYKLTDYCITIRSTAEKASAAIDTIDILHLDGQHSDVAPKRDVQLYLPKVRSGGYIFLNDSLWKQMMPATLLLAETCDIVKLIDNGNCIVFKKR